MIIISDKEIMFWVTLDCLFVFLFVCYQHQSKSYEPVVTKFYGWVLGGKREQVITFWWRSIQITMLTAQSEIQPEQ